MDKDDVEGGFTLVEMLLVVLLLALAAGLVFSRAGQDRSAVTLSASLGDYLREARALAVIEGRIVTLELDADTGQLFGPPPVGRLELDGSLALETSQPPANSLSFYPDGSTVGGVLHILPRSGERAGAGRRLAVAPLTGAVTTLP